MRILFSTSIPYFPQHFGGIEVNLDHICRGLTARGHDVRLVARLSPRGFTWARNRVVKKLFGPIAFPENFNGYKVYRSFQLERTPDLLCSTFRPDIVVGHAGPEPDLLFTDLSLSRPTAIHLHGVLPLERASRLYEIGIRNYICCSQFLKSRLLEKIPADSALKASVIYNAFDIENYRVEPSKEFVTFINPVPQKGLRIALELCEALPQIPFQFVRSWPMSPLDEKRVQRLKNVRLIGPVMDMKSIYRRTRVLIVPSVGEEGAGRVITEAQISGIPVIGSDRGGIPETVGEGGIILRTIDVRHWIEALQTLWNNDTVWHKFSRKARQQSEDFKFSYQAILKEYEAFLEACIVAHPRSRHSAYSRE